MMAENVTGHGHVFDRKNDDFLRKNEGKLGRKTIVVMTRHVFVHDFHVPQDYVPEDE